VLALSGLVVADVWEWSPLLALLLFAAMQTIPQEHYEAARVDGASGWQLFWRIVLPQIRGMVVVAAGLRFMDAFLELDKVFIMTGGGPGAWPRTRRAPRRPPGRGGGPEPRHSLSATTCTGRRSRRTTSGMPRR
jgi:ABC-type sugar transport system permease subunit